MHNFSLGGMAERIRGLEHRTLDREIRVRIPPTPFKTWASWFTPSCQSPGMLLVYNREGLGVEPKGKGAIERANLLELTIECIKGINYLLFVYMQIVLIIIMYCSITLTVLSIDTSHLRLGLLTRRVKPVFHGACFGAVSAPTLYVPYPRQVRPYPARIRRVQSRRRNRSKTRSMENGLKSSRCWTFDMLCFLFHVLYHFRC